MFWRGHFRLPQAQFSESRLRIAGAVRPASLKSKAAAAVAVGAAGNPGHPFFSAGEISRF